MDQENAYIDELGLQYVAGYILAMEDVLNDLDKLRMQADSDSAIIEGIEQRVTESWNSARKTLKVVQEKMDNG